jgi:hypothetical protein
VHLGVLLAEAFGDLVRDPEPVDHGEPGCGPPPPLPEALHANTVGAQRRQRQARGRRRRSGITIDEQFE